ncbi:hypothetical protein E2C01_057765 [Portunus trituberculatus]|uniref:Uncharacterized protein n=1 Tax=Portunus trituberculatus TaxID=210409 RepID=A0A5B7H499_PORTR|nr:hypothetical protein [Portunus trituberculatus]
MMVRAAWPWPEGQPNCNISGEWSDPLGAETLSAAVVARGGNASTLEVAFNSTGGHYRGAAPLEDGKAAALKMTGTKNDSLLLHLLCLNDVLWAMQTPLYSSPRMIRMFSFRRREVPAPLQDTASPAPSSSAPEFILVNISLPKRQEDDHRQRDDQTALA